MPSRMVSKRHEHRLAAFDGEALLADETAVQEALEGFRFEQPAQGIDLVLGVGLGVEITAFHAVQQPRTHFRVVNVHELEARLPAVDAAQLGQHRLELHRLAATEQVRLHLLFQLGLGRSRGPPA